MTNVNQRHEVHLTSRCFLGHARDSLVEAVQDVQRFRSTSEDCGCPEKGLKRFGTDHAALRNQTKKRMCPWPRCPCRSFYLRLTAMHFASHEMPTQQNRAEGTAAERRYARHILPQDISIVPPPPSWCQRLAVHKVSLSGLSVSPDNPRSTTADAGVADIRRPARRSLVPGHAGEGDMQVLHLLTLFAAWICLLASR